MDFRQSTIQHSEQKYAKILKGEAPPPYDGSVKIGSSDTYSSKRNAYVNRLSRENSEFDSAVRKINDTKNARLRNENDALERKAIARYKLFKMLKTIAFLLPIFLLAFMGIDISSNSDKYQLVSYTPYGMLWIIGATASVIVAVIAIICLYKKEIYHSRTNIKNEVKFSVLAIAVASVAVLVTALFLITKPSTSKDEDFVFIKGENGIVLMEYTGDAEIVIFPDTYKGKTYMVHYGLFYNNENAHKITKLVVPATSSFIGYYYSAIHSFSLLTSLRDATIPVNMIDYIPKNTLEAVTINGGYGSRIDGSAFYGCTSLTSVTIGEGVTSIDSYAFRNCTSLTSIEVDKNNTAYKSIDGNLYSKDGKTLIQYAIGKKNTSFVIPNSVTSIGEYAFYGCTSLTSVTIPDSVTSIGSNAFSDCTSLTSVTIPDSVASIDWQAFYNCTSLTSVTIGDSVTEIGGPAFTDCPIENATIPTTAISYIPKEKLKTVVINGGASIDDEAFRGYTSLTSVTIGEGVTEIGSSAFYECTSLTSVTIGDSVTEIGDLAFSGCTSLTSVTIPDSVTEIGDEAFYGCTSLTSVTIPSSVTSIGYDAFTDCPIENATIPAVAISYIPQGNLKTVVISGGDSISYEAFRDCTLLTSVTIGDSVTEIGYQAFYGCTSLTSVTIGDSVTSIGNWTFENCTSLTSIEVDENNTAYKSIDGNLYSKDGKTLIQYAIGKTDTSFVVPDSVTSIGKYAFYKCTSLTSVTIPNSVTTIGEDAFDGCTSLTSVTIPDSVTEIDSDAFTDCPIENATIPTTAISYIPQGKLKTVVINGGDSIGSSAFDDCTSLTSVTIGDSVTSIGYYAFEDCTSLTSVTIGDSVTTIGNSAFSGCTSLTSITIGDSVTTIGHSAFSYCTSLTSVTIPDSVTSIYSHAFSGCTSLTSVTIPDSVTSIGDYAFYGCTSLTSIIIEDSVTSIGYNAFYGCPIENATIPTTAISYIPQEKLKTVVINGGGSIGGNAFYNCTSLTSVTIGDSVTSIGYQAFYGCPIENATVPATAISSIPKGKLKAVVINGGRSIGNSAFENCTSLTSVTIGDSVTSIGYGVFYGCTSLTSVTIGDSVTTIGDYAFQNCTSLTSIEVDKNNEAYKSTDGNLYFKDGKTLIQYAIGKKNTSFVIPNSVTSIGNNAFSYCTSLTSVTIGDSVTSIGEYAFYDCTSLTSITIPDSVTEIGNYAFYGCSKLTSVTIPDSVTSIGEYAFFNCTSLTSVTIGDSVTSIGGSAFSGCSKLKYNEYDNALYLGNEQNPYLVLVKAKYKSITSCTINENTRFILTSAFYECKSLTSITIPNSVTSIGGSAFYNCTSLTSVTIPDSVTEIGNYAFRGCTSLTSVTIPNSITSIGYEAFYGCSSLTEINCEAESRPDGWNSNWKYGCNATVVWGYKGE